MFLRYSKLRQIINDIRFFPGIPRALSAILWKHRRHERKKRHNLGTYLRYCPQLPPPPHFFPMSSVQPTHHPQPPKVQQPVSQKVNVNERCYLENQCQAKLTQLTVFGFLEVWQVRVGCEESWGGGCPLPKLLEQRGPFGCLPVSDSIFARGYLISACPASERRLHMANKQGCSVSLSSSP